MKHESLISELALRLTISAAFIPLLFSPLSLVMAEEPKMEIRNIMGHCLDVAGGVNTNRTNVQIFDCNGTASQQWSLTSGNEIRNIMGRCLDVAGGVNANRTNVQLFDCNGTISQQWFLTARNEIRNVLGRCLDVAGGVNANRTNVQIFDCNSTVSQRWTLIGSTSGQTSGNFDQVAGTCSIAGRVAGRLRQEEPELDGRGKPTGRRVTRTVSQLGLFSADGNLIVTTPLNNGNYIFSNVEAGKTYRVAPAPNWQFRPQNTAVVCASKGFHRLDIEITNLIPAREG
jgi:hypothetical protein